MRAARDMEHAEADGGESDFFFSSRRRHTRSYGDWSSDVCSSDLCTTRRQWLKRSVARSVAWVGGWRRSEERRVGKECRSRWSPEHQKKKAESLPKPKHEKRRHAAQLSFHAPDLRESNQCVVVVPR